MTDQRERTPNMKPETTTTVASLIKRGTPSAWPHELVLATDPKDPLCDVERLLQRPQMALLFISAVVP